ncbi:TolC family protein [Algiphilus sp. W345]|uniref:TolC family protein n=1 Tax=Banduia mediterranea TaxID=3075609 RepID=A0ABU2WJD9_9GAMM|nr:TolC family protein [Algiphilus sp. W345]MDT0497729.1 TolC family protein [Algiphilus sp. W345]
MLSRPQAWPLGAGLAVSLCLNACVAPLELDRSLAMPIQYDEAASDTTDSPELRHWWRRFDDPLLARLVERAVAHNYDVRIALASVQSARAQALRAHSALLPQFGAAASADRYGIDPDNQQLAEQGYDEFRVDQWQLALQTSWEVDLFGSSRLRLQAAQQQQLASLAEVHATRLSIAASVAQTYFELRATDLRMGNLRQGRDIARQFADIAARLFKSGDVGREDLISAQAELDNTDAQLAELQHNRTRLRLSLERLCGELPGSLEDELPVIASLPQLPPAVAPGQPVDLLMRRPDLMALQAQVRAATAQSSASRRELWPSLNISGVLARSRLYLDGDNLGLTDMAQLSASMSLPLIDFGARRAAIELADSDARQSMLRFESRVLQAMQEVEEALSAQHSGALRVASLQAAVDRRSEVLEIALRRYEIGDGARPDVLQARRDLLDSRDALLGARLSLLEVQLQLYRALGGGWEPLMTQVPPPADEDENTG